MTTGDTIKSENNKKYTITENIAAEDRPNANVYLCEDENGKKFIAKHFYKQRPMPYIAYAKWNHYGRRRDGSNKVFNEIKEAGKNNEFIIDHIDRIKHKGKWVIILEYINGITLNEFIMKNKSNKVLVFAAVIALAKTLSEWHRNGFAHGDPHLGNCLIISTGINGLEIYLIDYSQIHHKDFHYCKHFDCFKSNHERRLKEDLINPSKKLGRGFKFEISALSEKLGYGNDLTVLFDEHYSHLVQVL
jgi:serine/threonine protein kinase